MNRQKNYYGLKKNSYTKKSNKNKSKDKQLNPNNNNYTNKINIMNQFNNYNNQPYTATDYFNNKKQINKMMNDYNLFVKKHLGDSNPLASISEERINKLLEEKSYRNNQNKNIFLEDEYNNEFQQLLKNNEDLDFGEEDFSVHLPLDDEFSYSQTDQLGKHKNNDNDYARRKKVLIKNDEEERRKKEGCKRLFPAFYNRAKIYYSEFIQGLTQYGEHYKEKKNISAKKIQKYYKAKKSKEKERRKKEGCKRLFQAFYKRAKFYYSEFIQSLTQYGENIKGKKNISAKKIQKYYRAKKRKEKERRKKEGYERLFQVFYHRIKLYSNDFIQSLIQYGEYKQYIEEKKK